MLDFNVHYAPWGSYSSFIFGRLGKGGGFALSDVQSPGLPIYAGYWHEDGGIKVFPFFQGSDAPTGQEKFNTTFGASSAGSIPLKVFERNEIQRDFAWCRDRFSAPGMAMTFHTPQLDVPELDSLSYDLRRHYTCPAILLELELDNSSSSSAMTAFFALGGINRGFAKGYRSGIEKGEEMSGTLAGAGSGTRWGFACRAGEGIREHQAWEFIKSAWSKATGRHGRHGLGGEGGILISLAPGEQRRIVLALGTFQEGIITAGVESRLYYTTCFRNLEDVLTHALDSQDTYLAESESRSRELADSDLPPERQFLLAQASRSYLASTQLLLTRNGETLFVVNEGEYRMMNTLDLTVDQAFWELQFSPWTVRNELDFHLGHSSYRDRHGLSFSHDQGVNNVFAPPGSSSYEVAEVTDCFSFMTFEELLNWIITAVLYARLGKDHAWIEARAGTLDEVLDSCLKRDANKDGLMDLDSDRCGGGAEITTYDSLDTSLGQARNNLYIGLKTIAACTGLALVFQDLGHKDQARRARDHAALCAASIAGHFDQAQGYIPAVFEGGNSSRIIPALEALVYPALWGDQEFFSPSGAQARLLELLALHMRTVLQPGICLDAQSGGWKLSSSSNNTWLSKIFINQFVAQYVMGLEDAPWDAWDRIHAGWLRGPSGDFAATDQINSTDGSAMGSRLYPRLVTAILWLRHSGTALKAF